MSLTVAWQRTLHSNVIPIRSFYLNYGLQTGQVFSVEN